MRHQNKTKKIGSASASHRHAKLNALATALFKNKKIVTTLAKAKAARIFSEKLITMAKKNDVHAKRMVGRFVREREVLQTLFSEIIDKIGQRPGGYTRIIKLGHRYGDGAEMAILELVDYNVVSEEKKEPVKEDTKTTTKPKSKKKDQAIEDAVVTEVTSEQVVKADAPAEETKS